MSHAHDAAANAATIDAIPADLPPGDPLPSTIRAALRELALAGRDVYAYHAIGDPSAWNVWRGDVVDPQTGYRGVRLPVAVWRTWTARIGGDA